MKQQIDIIGIFLLVWAVWAIGLGLRVDCGLGVKQACTKIEAKYQEAAKP